MSPIQMTTWATKMPSSNATVGLVPSSTRNSFVETVESSVVTRRDISQA